MIALPAMDGPALPGLPQDEHGFIPIDQHARVTGVDDVYAAGDGTNFPIKQGGLGTQQADAAAAHIADRLGAAVAVGAVSPGAARQADHGRRVASPSRRRRGGRANGRGLARLPVVAAAQDQRPLPSAVPLPRRGHAEPEPPGHSLDVEVSLPVEWHAEPMALDPYETPRVD